MKTIEDMPGVYQIRIGGELGGEWSAWFGGMDVSSGGYGDTLLTGTVNDQAALYGLLKKIRDAGLFLVSVNSLENGGSL